MGGIHRKGFRITLNDLITERDRLNRRIDAMFFGYAADKCEYFVAGTSIVNRCSHGSNPEECTSNYKSCCPQCCPEREKI